MVTNSPGVYAIIDDETNQKYIGSAKNVYSRTEHHEWLLKNGKHYNRRLQSAYDANHHFRYECLVPFRNYDKPKIRNLEKLLIRALKTHDPAYGFNLQNKPAS